MNLALALRRREHGLVGSINYDFALRRLCLAREDCWLGIKNDLPDWRSGYIFRALLVQFSNCRGYEHLFALADGRGNIAIQDSTVRNYEPLFQDVDGYKCHETGIFGLEWVPWELKIVSGSSDQTATLWQVKNSGLTSIRSFSGHKRTVQSIAFETNNSNVFATGGRDNAIYIWDTRVQEKVDAICDSQFDVTYQERYLGLCGVTGLVFQPQKTQCLLSTDNHNAEIKVWDLRKRAQIHSLPYAEPTHFEDFADIIVDNSGTRLYLNRERSILCYDILSYSPQPLMTFQYPCGGPTFRKFCLSPDNRYLICGSNHAEAYLWDVNEPDKPLVCLGSMDVDSVAWCSTYDQPIVTCGLRGHFEIWRIVANSEDRDIINHARICR